MFTYKESTQFLPWVAILSRYFVENNLKSYALREASQISCPLEEMEIQIGETQIPVHIRA
ncbi:MAG: hypothetical protein K8L91_04720 [Anaerolineae bacterium]|nr:hypothetical protein [Anaerolineae bacterium]